MLAVRLQRVGRKGHAQFRMIVQDSRFHPSSGRVVAYLGSYDPHSKQSQFDKEKLLSYLTSGAQPSPRVIKLLKAEKVKLPAWVSPPPKKKKATRNPDKRRSTRPVGAPEPKFETPVPTAEESETTENVPMETQEASEQPAGASNTESEAGSLEENLPEKPKE